MEERFSYDEKLLDKAEELKYKHKLKWKEVAETLGIPHSRSLVEIVSRRRRGQYGKKIKARSAWKAEIPKVEEKIKAGVSDRDLAADYGISLHVMRARLRRVGLDPEMRRELREMKDMEPE